MDARGRTETAVELMLDFAERTGLTSERPPGRYLWTDAFAVCNFLSLARATGEGRYRELALRLVDQTHHVLGRHRSDDPRSGWISGLGEQQGDAHPTKGGLRIGKQLPERRPGEPFDERLEWERDGQYFHYLTKWMHALDQLSRATQQRLFNLWARELAAAAHGAFVQRSPGRLRMAWKMSTDLSRPLVATMGHHDPLDGFITCAELRATASRSTSAPSGPSLEAETADFATMTEGGNWATTDPLGIGGLLMDAARVAQLLRQGAMSRNDLLDDLVGAALQGLVRYARSGALQRPASQRLAFRELGLAIGLHASRLVGGSAGEALAAHAPLGAAIELCWLDPAHRRLAAWREHRDINEVMLATSLSPDGCLVLD
jgi:hypothetical protein